MNTDFSQLDPLKQDITTAQTQAANLTEKAPGLLESLRQNLINVFSKNNPIIAERDTALSNFLSSGAKARAETLPSALPEVAGSQLNLSPTQQNAIVESRRSAALAPLAGLNQIVSAMYGNIPQIVSSAGNIYQSQIEAAGKRAQLAQQSYENAFRELQQKEAIRQFNVQEGRLAGKAKEPPDRVIKDVQELETGISDLNASIDEIKNARALIEGRGGANLSGSGPGFLRNQRRGGLFGGINEKSAQLEARLSKINEALFSVAGKAFTGSEKGLLMGKVLDIKNDEPLLLQQLNELEAAAEREKINYFSQYTNLYNQYK